MSQIRGMSVYVEDYDWSTPDPSLNVLDNLFKTKSSRDRDNRNDNSFYEYRMQQQREAEQRRIEEEKKLAQEAEMRRKQRTEQQRREAEFQTSHKKLQASLHTLPNQSNGLKGQNTTKFGLRGLENKTANNSASTSISNQQSSIQRTSSSNAYEVPPQKTTKRKPYFKDNSAFLQEVVISEPEPAYYQGSSFWSMGGGWDFPSVREDWVASGEDNVKNHLKGLYEYWTGKQGGWTPMGAQLVQSYDSLSRSISIRDAEKSIIVRTLDAIKRAAITGDRSYVENINGANLKDTYKVTKSAGVPDVPLNQKEAVGWVQKYFLKKTAPNM